MFDPDFQTISHALGSPLEAVTAHWPSLKAELLAAGVHYDSGIIAALATISVEVRGFKPINEIGGPAYFTRMYDITSPDPKRVKVAKSLGNTEPGMGQKFHGRGYIQLTGFSNYKAMSTVAGVDLVANPDAALDPHIAAKIFAHYFRTHACDVRAERAYNATTAAAKDAGWKAVRKSVNGGLNNYKEFKISVDKLTALAKSQSKV